MSRLLLDSSIVPRHHSKHIRSCSNEAYLGIINQRGVHYVDPEGKPELELAEENRQKAETAETKGYSRFADIFIKIAAQYESEAQRNIARALNKQ